MPFGTSLATALCAAGVRGAGDGQSAVTIAEIKALATNRGVDEYAKKAMNNLPPELMVLEGIRKGEEFLSTLKDILLTRRDSIARGQKTFEFEVHEVYGIVQLVHQKRDELSGSRRTSFQKLIARFLRAKHKAMASTDTATAFLKEL